MFLVLFFPPLNKTLVNSGHQARNAATKTSLRAVSEISDTRIARQLSGSLPGGRHFWNSTDQVGRIFN